MNAISHASFFIIEQQKICQDADDILLLGHAIKKHHFCTNIFIYDFDLVSLHAKYNHHD